jgi:putative FmdB family regulatory protein
MPMYEYVCERCGEKFEKLILSPSTKVVCPRCGSSACEQVYSSFAFSVARKVIASVRSGSGCGCSAGGCACHRG